MDQVLKKWRRSVMIVRSNGKMIDNLVTMYGNPTGFYGLMTKFAFGNPYFGCFSFNILDFYITSCLHWSMIWCGDQHVAISKHCCMWMLLKVVDEVFSFAIWLLTFDLATWSLHRQWCHWSAKISSDSLVFFRRFQKLLSDKLENDKMIQI